MVLSSCGSVCCLLLSLFQARAMVKCFSSYCFLLWYSSYMNIFEGAHFPKTVPASGSILKLSRLIREKVVCT